MKIAVSIAGAGASSNWTDLTRVVLKNVRSADFSMYAGVLALGSHAYGRVAPIWQPRDAGGGRCSAWQLATIAILYYITGFIAS